MAGVAAGSISLVGFGLDSFIEVTSGATLLWRMSVDADVQSRERNERLSLRIVGMCFIVLAIYIAYEDVSDLIAQKPPEHSIPGIILACVSLIVMPILSRAKKKTMGLYEMKYSFLIGIALTFGIHGLAAQSVQADAKSQKTVVASFVEMETEGGRLIPEGWRKASAFFVRSSPFTPDAKIAVIEKNYSVWDAMVIPPTR